MTISFGLHGKAILVTGANSGIGRGIAVTLARHGADIAVHYLDGETWQAPGAAHAVPGIEAAYEVAEEIEKLGRRTVCLAADLADATAPFDLVARAEAALGSLTGLVNNAAAAELPDGVLDAEWNRYRRHFDVNLAAPTLLTRAFVEQKIRRGGTRGSIVNISTDAARAFPGQVFYGTSKAALEAMTRASALELGPHGITINAVAPGPVQTGWIDDNLASQVIPSIPLRRLGTPEDIAFAVAFLVSDASAWITGQIIQVAGGHAL